FGADSSTSRRRALAHRRACLPSVRHARRPARSMKGAGDEFVRSGFGKGRAGGVGRQLVGVGGQYRGRRDDASFDVAFRMLARIGVEFVSRRRRGMALGAGEGARIIAEYQPFTGRGRPAVFRSGGGEYQTLRALTPVVHAPAAETDSLKVSMWNHRRSMIVYQVAGPK